MLILSEHLYTEVQNPTTLLYMYIYVPEDMFYCLVNALYNYFYANFGVFLKECLSYSPVHKDNPPCE